jgi:ABC-2 type transport system permease protein/lipopolysaccharide transport system permease protein
MLSLAIVIPMIARFQIPNYVVFLFSGITVWWAINGSIISGGDSIIHSEDLIKKVYIPRIIFPFVHVTIELINLFIAFLSLFVLGIIFGLHIKPNFIFLFVSIGVSYLFCLGLGFIMSILVVYFRDLKHITGVVLQAIFYISAIIFPADMIPPEYRIFLTVNPFYHFIKLFQSAIYNPINADWNSFAIPTIIALTCLWVGLLIQWVFGKKIVYQL